MSNLYDLWVSNNIIESNSTQFKEITSENIGEFCFYKYIDHPKKDAEIVSATDIKNAIDYFNQNNISKVVVHYGHYFNADYNEIFTLLHFFKNWYKGEVIAFSPEEIVFLAIVGDKDVDSVISQLRSEKISHVLGFLPESVFDSKYYADDDELFIDDRNHLFEKFLKNNISFIYPFNIGQAEDKDEFESMVNFIKTNNLKEIILQPNRVYEAIEDFNYERGQRLISQLFSHFLLPQRSLPKTKIYFTDKSFEILYKFVHI